MWDLFLGSVKLFLQGRLFSDQKMAARQIVLGMLVAFVLTLVVYYVGAPLWLAAIIGGGIGGALGPVFCINLRMK